LVYISTEQFLQRKFSKNEPATFFH